MIQSFRCKETEKLFNDIYCKKFATIERVARKRLEALEAAQNIEDLRIPPGNRLEALKGNRKGQYSIRIINDQWRYVLSGKTTPITWKL